MTVMQANLPNLRRLFVEARTEAEENEYSRNAVCITRMSTQSMDERTNGNNEMTVLQSRPFYFLCCCV